MPFRFYRCLLTILPLLIASTASATTRRVPSEFPTIQSGIDASAVGDTVLVAPGTYTGVGNRRIGFGGKDIVLISEAGAEVTTIDAQGGPYPTNPQWVFRLSSGLTSAARIDGFTITGGTQYGAGTEGAGVICAGASPTIANCVIRGNWAGDGNPYQPSKDGASRGCGVGGGLLIGSTSTPMTVVNCLIEDNGSECYGGAVYVTDAQDVTFERCVIVQNREIGVYIRQPASCTFTNCTIANTAGFDDTGAGVLAAGSVAVHFDRSVVWGNCSGVWIDSAASVEATCSVIDSSNVMGPGDITYVGANFLSDPLFCSPRGCPLPVLGDPGDYRVHSASPCLPENNSCGVLIGALGLCAGTSVPTDIANPNDVIWAFPNPFSTTTTLSLPAAAAPNATLTVFDIAGRQIREFSITSQTVTWDGTDESGRPIGGGTYFLKLRGAPRDVSSRVTLVR